MNPRNAINCTDNLVGGTRHLDGAHPARRAAASLSGLVPGFVTLERAPGCPAAHLMA
jgi:hypothetical protein